MDSTARGHGIGCIFDQVNQDAGEIFGSKLDAASAAFDVDRDGDAGTGKSREQVAVCKQFRGQVGDGSCSELVVESDAGRELLCEGGGCRSCRTEGFAGARKWKA